MVIAGHNYARHFSRIKGLENGTKVRFTDVEGHVFPYRITSREVLSPTQNEKLIKKSDKWDLTMFTCTWGGTRRHVVRCSLEN
jgi:sortase A